jgi:hypothetical protein
VQVVLLGLVLILPVAACGWWPAPTPDTRGDLTVFNRTANALTVTDTDQSLTVAGCGEASASNFRINQWKITGLGLHTFSTGRGSFGPHVYILVTVNAAPDQTDTRPSTLPTCRGIPVRLRGAVPSPTPSMLPHGEAVAALLD